MSISSLTQQQEIVLLLLKRGELYGLEMVRIAEECTGDRYALPIGTLYPTLQKLQKKGLVKSRREEEITPGGRRRYYSLTPVGAQAIAAVEQYRHKLTGEGLCQ